MSKFPKSFVMVLRRRYRLYFNPQGASWYVAFAIGNNRKRVSLGVKTRPEAEDAVRQLDNPPVVERKPGGLLWEELQQKFLEHKKMIGRTARTVSRCNASLDAFGRYLKEYGIFDVEQLTLTVLEGYFAYRTKEEKCDPISAYTDQIVLKGAFKFAARPSRGLLKANPALDWETPKPLKPRKPVYKLAEVEKLETGVREWLRPIVTTLAWTGMRIGELLNLRWKDVDLENRVIRIRIQEDWNPKGRRDRTVPIHPKVEAVLRKQRIGEHVFVGPEGGRIKQTYCLQCLKTDQENLKMQKGDLHGFRRFFATTMMQAGVSTETVRQWGGWKSLEVMLRYLAEVDVKDSVAAMDKAVKHLAS